MRQVVLSNLLTCWCFCTLAWPGLEWSYSWFDKSAQMWETSIRFQNTRWLVKMPASWLYTSAGKDINVNKEECERRNGWRNGACHLPTSMVEVGGVTIHTNMKLFTVYIKETSFLRYNNGMVIDDWRPALKHLGWMILAKVWKESSRAIVLRATKQTFAQSSPRTRDIAFLSM